MTRRTFLKGSAAALVAAGSTRPVRATTPSLPDVVIVGGGFAGVTAARELSMRGRTAVLVEARERLGGRTYTASFEGHDLELGGTWVHSAQPNVWAEVTRYGLDTEDIPAPGSRLAVLSAGNRIELGQESLVQMLEAIAQFCAPAAELFPAPYTPRWGPDPERYGDRSVREYLASLQLPPVARDGLDGIFCTLGSAALDQVAVSEMLRPYALAGYSPVQMLAAVSGTKIATGTRSLIDAIVTQASLAEIRLQSPVQRVVQTNEGVRVELHGGGVVAGRTALITLPINTLNRVAFEPALSPIKRAAAEERHAGSGVKLYVRVKGDVGNVSALAPESEAINSVATYHHGADGSLLVVFGKDPADLNVHDVDKMQRALERLLPGVEVERMFGWDWTADPFALGTWCVFRPGQPGRFLPELRRAEGRLFFASGDSAVGWHGYIDGAIESGYRAAREIDHHLG